MNTYAHPPTRVPVPRGLPPSTAHTRPLPCHSQPPPIFATFQGSVVPSYTWGSLSLPSDPRIQAPTPHSPRGRRRPSPPWTKAHFPFPIPESNSGSIHFLQRTFHPTTGWGSPRPWQGCHSATYSALTSGMWPTDSPGHVAPPRTGHFSQSVLHMRQSQGQACAPHLLAGLVS